MTQLRPIRRVHALTGRELDVQTPMRGETIAHFVERTGYARGLPVVVGAMRRGQLVPVPRKHWHHAIGRRSELVCISAPTNGGGNNNGGGGGSRGVASIIGLVAVLALAAVVAGPLAGFIGLGGSAAATSVISALIIGGGSYLLSHFLGAKRGAKSQAQEYSVDITSNTARSQQPIPVQYGRVKFFPDQAAPPWSDYSGTDQVFHVLFSLGVGVFDIEEIGIANTPVYTAAGGVAAGFPNFKYEFVPPGTACTLFPTDVYTSPEVSGQTLPDPYGTTYDDGSRSIGPNGETSGVEWVGPFVANPSGTQTNQIAVDIIFGGGLYIVDSKNGNTKPYAVQIDIDYQAVDDQGIPTGQWVPAVRKSYYRESRLPVRITEAITVVPGRYQVRMARDNRAGINNAVDAATWSALKTYLIGPNAIPYTYRLAVEMLADKQLSGYSSSQIYVIATRHIPVYDPGTGTMVTQATRNPVWAALDVWNNADYGGNLPLTKVDIITLSTLATAADARGDAFNYRFTQQMTVLEAIQTCLRVMLTAPIFLWDQFSMVRDQVRPLPAQIFTDAEIYRGTLELAYTLQDTQTSDGVIVEYVEEQTWKPAEVTSRAPGVTLLQPTRIQLPGITVRSQATLAARKYAADNQYRRKVVNFEIENEARLLRRGDQVIVQSELPQSWSQVTRPLSFDGNLTIHAETSLQWTTASAYYIRVRRRGGTPWGPVKVARGSSDDVIVVDHDDIIAVQAVPGMGTLADALARDSLQEPASISFSPGAASEFVGLVTALAPGSQENAFKVSLVNDDPRVYTIDGQSVEPLPTPSPLVLPAFPANLSLVVAYLAQENTSLMLYASWSPDPVAVEYLAQVSFDNGETWNYTVYNGPFAEFVAGPMPDQTLLLRIRGTSAANIRGPWTQLAVATPGLVLAPASLGYVIQYTDVSPDVFEGVALVPLTQVEDQTGALMAVLNDAKTSQSKLSQDIANAHAAVERLDYAKSTNDLALAGSILSVTATVNANAATFSQEIQTQADATSALSSIVTNLSATVTTNVAAINASITQEAQTRATADTSLSTLYTTLNSTFTSNLATTNANITAESQTRATAVSSLSGQITTLTAVTNAGTANGAISWATSSGPGGAVTAAYNLQLNASGVTSAQSGLYLYADGAGVSRVVITASRFSIQDAGTSFAPFGIISGVIYLQGVTRFSQAISSQTLTNSGNPVMTLSAPSGSITMWDNT